MGFLSCNSPVNHSCFGINSFNVGLLEVSAATVDRQTVSDRIGIDKNVFVSHLDWIGSTESRLGRP